MNSKDQCSNLLNHYNKICSYNNTVSIKGPEEIIFSGNDIETIKKCLENIKKFNIDIEEQVHDNFVYLIQRAFCIRFITDAEKFLDNNT